MPPHAEACRQASSAQEIARSGHAIHKQSCRISREDCRFSPPRRHCGRFTFAPPSGRARARRRQGRPPQVIAPRRRSWAAGHRRRSFALATQAAQLPGVPSQAGTPRTGAPRPRALLRFQRAGALVCGLTVSADSLIRVHPGRTTSSRRARARPARCFAGATGFCPAVRRSTATRGRPPPSPLPCTLPPNPRRAASRPPRGMRKRLKQGRGAGLAVPVRHWRHGQPRWAGLGCVLPRRVCPQFTPAQAPARYRLPRAAPRSCARGPPVWLSAVANSAIASSESRGSDARPQAAGHSAETKR